jgi:hypothetical protein
LNDWKGTTERTTESDDRKGRLKATTGKRDDSKGRWENDWKANDWSERPESGRLESDDRKATTERIDRANDRLTTESDRPKATTENVTGLILYRANDRFNDRSDHLFNDRSEARRDDGKDDWKGRLERLERTIEKKTTEKDDWKAESGTTGKDD